MSKEKVVLSFIAVLAGLLVAGVAFYFYQSTKVIPKDKIKTISIDSQQPTPTSFSKSGIFLEIDAPKDESVTDKKTVTVSGKTINDAVVIISTNSSDEVVTTAQNGNFSTTMTIEDGENQIEITAIAPNGEEQAATRTITFSTETF